MLCSCKTAKLPHVRLWDLVLFSWWLRCPSSFSCFWMVCGLLATADSYWGASLLLIHFLHFEKKFCKKLHTAMHISPYLFYIYYFLCIWLMYVFIANNGIDLWHVERLKRHHTILKVMVLCLHFCYLFIFPIKASERIFLCTNVSKTDFVSVWVNVTDELVRC